MGLRVRFVGTTTGYQAVDGQSISRNKKTCQVIINVVLHLLCIFSAAIRRVEMYKAMLLLFLHNGNKYLLSVLGKKNPDTQAGINFTKK